ncbi:g12538 [Coccomyxa viridis]|uniref:G12538 protein n=1 Tax=Coccomyxa viridis TaxID=1274662 RepID=A0ABP1GEV9_9CHLO
MYRLDLTRKVVPFARGVILKYTFAIRPAYHKAFGDMLRHGAQALLVLCGLAACLGVSADLQQLNLNGAEMNALRKQAATPPVPSQTVSPCKAIDPQCVDCANNVCTACNIIFTLDDATKKCVCPDGQQLAQDGTTCINMNLVNVGKFLYNNTAVQDGLYKATMKSVHNNKAVDSFVATTAKSAANLLQTGQNSIKQSASKVLASALAPVVQPAEFVAAPKQPLPESAPAPEVAAGAAMAGQGLPLPSGPALAPGDSAYEQLVAEGKAQQAQEIQSARAKILQASGLAPAQAIAPTVASVGSALQQAQQTAAVQQQQAQPSQAAPQQASQTQAAATPSGLNPISALISQAGGLLQNYLPNLGRRLLRE